MRSVIFFSILFIHVLVMPVHARAAEPQAIDIFSSIAGTFEGEVLNGGTYDRSVTIFRLNPDGRLVGNYTDYDEAGTFNGTISNVRLEGPRTISFEWTDKDGEGFAQLNFSSDFQTFSGFWGSHDSQGRYPWFGSRQ